MTFQQRGGSSGSSIIGGRGQASRKSSAGVSVEFPARKIFLIVSTIKGQRQYDAVAKKRASPQHLESQLATILLILSSVDLRGF